AGMLIDEADVHFLVLVAAQIDGDAAQVLLLDAGHAGDELVASQAAPLGGGLAKPEFNAGLHPRPAADQERRPGMRDLEWHAGQRPLRLVAEFLEAADPVLPLMLALVVGAALGDGIP